MKHIEEKLFLIIAFWLGTWGAIFNITQTVFIGLGLLYNIIKYRKDFFLLLKKYRYYVGIPIAFLLYLGIHTFFIIGSGKYDYSPSFGTFEAVASFFLLGVLYVLSARTFITVSLLRRFLIVFCVSVFSFNMYVFFVLGGTALFSEPLNTISNLYTIRFGGTKEFFGGKIYLDAQALQMAMAALFAYFFFFIDRLKKMKIMWGILFLGLLWFLSMTITKSSIIAFLSGFLLLNFYLFRYRLSGKGKKILSIVLVATAIIGYFCLPNAFKERIEEVQEEYLDLKEGNLAREGSITPRVVFYKTCFEHLDKYALWGLGVYTNQESKQWYLNSGNSVVASYTHSHNSYLQYWMIGGIAGIIFILSWFFIPVYYMFRNGKFSFISLAVLLAFFVDNNFEVLLIISDMTPVIIFFLAMFYLYNDEFIKMESKDNVYCS